MAHLDYIHASGAREFKRLSIMFLSFPKPYRESAETSAARPHKTITAMRFDRERPLGVENNHSRNTGHENSLPLPKKQHD